MGFLRSGNACNPCPSARRDSARCVALPTKVSPHEHDGATSRASLMRQGRTRHACVVPRPSGDGCQHQRRGRGLQGAWRCLAPSREGAQSASHRAARVGRWRARNYVREAGRGRSDGRRRNHGPADRQHHRWTDQDRAAYRAASLCEPDCMCRSYRSGRPLVRRDEPGRFNAAHDDRGRHRFGTSRSVAGPSGAYLGRTNRREPRTRAGGNHGLRGAFTHGVRHSRKSVGHSRRAEEPHGHC